jgi:hypothetical protein
MGGEVITQHYSTLKNTTTLAFIQPLATTLLADTIILRHFHCPHSSLYKPHIGATGFLMDS